MLLTPKQQNELINKLSQFWKDKNCPVCNEPNLNVSDTIFELREFHGGALKAGPSNITPVVTLTCPTCGNLILLNALHFGLVVPHENGEGGTSDENK